jgi:ankyrin repeat protein
MPKHSSLTLQDIAQRFSDTADFGGVKVHSVNQKGILGSSLLHLAAYHADHEAIKSLLLLGADPNLPGDRGDSPLHDAVLSKDIESVKILMFNGADPTQCNDFGCTALQRAEQEGATHLLPFLRKEK